MASKKKGKVGEQKDMTDVFEETKEDDASDAKLSAAGKRVKSCHLLIQEANALLIAARRETATNGIIRAELERVMELSRDIYEEAEYAQKALDR